jgi:hypothetical protein
MRMSLAWPAQAQVQPSCVHDDNSNLNHTANSKLAHVTWFFHVGNGSSRLWRSLGLGIALQPGLHDAVKVRRRHVKRLKGDAERSSCVRMEMHFWGNNLRAVAAELLLISTACRRETGLLGLSQSICHHSRGLYTCVWHRNAWRNRNRGIFSKG